MTSPSAPPITNTHRTARGAIPASAVTWLALGFALVSALWFLVRAGYKVLLTGGFAGISRDAGWMSPLSHAGLFLVAAIPVFMLTRFLKRENGLVVATALLGALAIHAVLLPWTQVGVYPSMILALGAGTALARRLTRNGEGPLLRLARRVVMGLSLTFAALSIIAAGSAVRHGRAAAPRGAAMAGAPDVLLIVLDTFRATAMGTYGSDRGITPALDTLASRGAIFDWAMSSSGWTLPAHATLFTGRYPQRLNTDFERALNRKEPTLAEAFAARGYETAGFAANLHYTTWESGLQRGFRRWEDYPRSLEMVLKSTLHGQTNMVEQLLRAKDRATFIRALRRKRLVVEPKPEGPPVDAAEITDRFLDWQAGRDTVKPYFAFLNYFDAHKPYLAAGPAARAGTDTSLAGYERDIAHLDRHVGRLLETLERAGRLRNTIVVLTADHGEHFGEHGLQGHANSVYTRLLHVPLLVRWEGHVPAGRRISRTVSQRDLAATLVDMAGLAGVQFPGVSLAAGWRDSLTTVSEVVAQHEFASGRDPSVTASEQGMTTILDERWQLIRSMRRALEEAYVYRDDPDEQRNLIGTDSAMALCDALVDRLRAALQGDVKGAPARIGAAPNR